METKVGKERRIGWDLRSVRTNIYHPWVISVGERERETERRRYAGENKEMNGRRKLGAPVLPALLPLSFSLHLEEDSRNDNGGMKIGDEGGPRIRRAQEEREKELHRISDSGGER